MDRLERLEQEIYDNGIAILEIQSEDLPCICGKLGSNYGIGIDRSRLDTNATQLTGLCHEFAHIELGTFRKLNSCSYETVERDERKTWDRTVDKLLPFEQFEYALNSCEGRVWEMAEMMGVTERLINKAYDKYRRKGLIC